MTDDIIPIDEARRRRRAEQADGALDGVIITPGESADGAGAAVDETKDETIARLCRLGPIEYDQARGPAAEALGIRTSTLDKVVASARGDGGSEELMFAEVAPAATRMAKPLWNTQR